MSLGCGEYSVYIGSRGGGLRFLKVAYSSIEIQWVLDNSGQAHVNVPTSAPGRSGCCEVLAESEPWRDEVVIFRGNDLVFVGPLITPEAGTDGGSLLAQDLFYWTERRFIEHDLHFFGDTTDCFKGIFEKAMEADPSPNIDVVTHETGVQAVRTYKGKDFHRAADLLRELARTALDFTVIGRTLYVGGQEVFAPASSPGQPLLIVDQNITSAHVTKDGSFFATDVAVFAGHGGKGTESRNVPLTGRATRGITTSGLVQQSFTELLIKDLDSANANATARLEAMQPTPLNVTVTLSANAEMDVMELIPGRRVDIRLSQLGCLDVDQVMRLTSVNLNRDATTESIQLQLVPLGLPLTEGSG